MKNKIYSRTKEVAIVLFAIAFFVFVARGVIQDNLFKYVPFQVFAEVDDQGGGCCQSEQTQNQDIPQENNANNDNDNQGCTGDCGNTPSFTPTPTPQPPSTPIPTPIHTPTPYPSNQPSHHPTPMPSSHQVPSHKASSVPVAINLSGQCPAGQIHTIIDSTIVCVAQNQEQTQTQTQTNNQNQVVNNNAVAQGGSSSSSSSSNSSANVTLNGNYYASPWPSSSPTSVNTTNYIYTTQGQVLGKVYYVDGYDKGGNPQVIAQAQSNIKELPRTGLPVAGILLASLFPAGLGIRKYLSQKKSEEGANAVWFNREFKK